MTNPQPVLNLLDLVARDMEATLTFYRRLGLEIPESAVWRTASGAHHVDLDLPNGFELHFDSIALAKSFNRGWPEQISGATRTIIGFSLPSRQAVDDRYAGLVAAGYTGRQSPYDAFWCPLRRDRGSRREPCRPDESCRSGEEKRTTRTLKSRRTTLGAAA